MALLTRSLTCVWLLSSLVLDSGEGNVMDWLTRCCIKGINKAERRNTLRVCEKDDLNRRSFAPMDKMICRHSERVCCVKQIQQRMCALGRYNAMQGKACHQRKPYIGGDHYRECCDCCFLGRKARLAKADCNDISMSFPCGAVYKECCETGSFTGSTPRPFKTLITERLIPRTLAPTTSPTTIPTTLRTTIHTTIPSTHTTTETTGGVPYPTGYLKCGAGVCEQLCEDSSGGALCYCRDGFMLQRDGRTCVDLDECLMGIHDCPADTTCVNNRGSFRCVKNVNPGNCNRVGYRNDSSGNCVDINECDEGDKCGASQTCLNTPGSYSCVCGVGYLARNDTCVDIDECSNGDSRCSADQPCVNTVGAYECRRAPVCPQGQVLGKSGCEAVTSCTNAKCPAGHVCEPTSDRDFVCNDIDECHNGTNNCKAEERCINTVGSFRCEAVPVINICEKSNCESGYQCIAKGNTYTCEDINECTTGRRCPRGTRCRNTVGSYRCEVRNSCTGVTCQRGHVCIPQSGKSPPFRCEDIDECRTDQAPCPRGQRCINIVGSYRCANRACRSGFTRQNGRCVDIDECRTDRAQCSAGQLCRNTVGSYRCYYPPCPSGRERRNGRCVDINECRTGQARCPRGQRCINNVGSYRCAYPACRNGFTRQNGRCVDIDECRTGQAQCPRGQRCINNVGSYRCAYPACRNGFTRRNGRCVDINECQSGQARCLRGQSCQNTPGSYRCYYPPCPSGHQRRNGVCVDIDECATGQNGCPANSRCKNNNGGYTCERTDPCSGRRCPRGTVCKSYGDRATCEALDICEGVTCPRGSECKVIGLNRYKCEPKNKDICSRAVCPTGTRCRATGVNSWSCDIVDVCLLARCPRGTVCVPTGRTYYQCKATSVCDGVQCRSGYRCVVENQRPKCQAIAATACNNVRCSRGYRCQPRNGRCEDIDECSSSPSLCNPGGRCINYAGSYYCSCRTGFRRTRNSKACTDVDECARRVCSQICRNTFGSYLCSCRDGFKLAGDKRTCVDLNECQRPGMCEHNCRNVRGSYVCSCRPGYRLQSDKRSCRDVNECSRGHEGTYCAYRCRNTRGSFRCVCPRGYTLSVDGFSCRDKDECSENRNICGSNNCVNTYGEHKCIPFSCPSRYYEKTSPSKCERRCSSGDRTCFGIRERAISYWTFPVRNNSGPRSVRFTYQIITRGYSKPVIVRYQFMRRRNLFRIIHDRRTNTAKVENHRTLKGPRSYQLQFVGEVLEDGVVTSRYINTLYIFVSRYKF